MDFHISPEVAYFIFGLLVGWFGLLGLGFYLSHKSKKDQS